MTQTNQWLQEEYTIDTPENVTFGFEVAGIGSRFIGALIDTVVIITSLLLLNVLLGVLLEFLGNGGVTDFINGNDEEMPWAVGIVLAIYVLLNFLFASGYYIIFELIWNGQTVGKRVAKIRVARVNGTPAGFLEIVVRNLVRMVDFLPVAYGVGLVVMFTNRHARRLGDFAAGTLVIKEQMQVTLASLGQSQVAATLASPGDREIEAWRQRFPALRRLRPADYALIQESLHRHDRGQLALPALYRLVDALARKVDCPPPNHDWQSARGFLADLAVAYRHLIE
ncbi:MAG: RDD family protein [Caldilineaceae bacterium]